MCGIAGIWCRTDDRRPDRPSLGRMIGTLRHRGPDGFGYFVQGAIGLAHARLSIIDLATGSQPIHNEDRTVSVVANGEIFNYIELRAELVARGHTFYTSSDTEVIVHLYEEHKERFVEFLNGQFAIALWDSRCQRLMLVRDRLGIRSLVYARVGERLLFGSEAKAIFAEGSVHAKLDRKALGQTLTYWAPLEGGTAFQGVESLPPGCVLTADAAGIRQFRYWDWDFSAAESTPSRSRESYAEELRSLLADSVRLQLRADVPVATYLSGGVDSAAITALVRDLGVGPVRAFSLSFSDPEFDESPYQREIAEYLGIHHTTVSVTEASIAAAFRRAIWHIETPILRTAPIPLMLLARVVHDGGCRVVLTGEGADEVFAGYDIFREAKIRRWIARHPGSRWRPRLLERLYPYLRHSPVRGGAIARQFFVRSEARQEAVGFSHLPRWTTTRRSWQFLSTELRAELGNDDPIAGVVASMPPGIVAWPALARAQYLEAHTLLSGYILQSQGDRVSMAHSVEGRLPYLDHRLVEFACRLPPSIKLRGLREKEVLKLAVRNLLPPRIVGRPKQPYRAPDSQSLVIDGRVRDEIADLLSPQRVRDAGYFDADAVSRLTEKCISGRAIGFGDNMSLVGIASTMALHDAFVLGRSDSAGN
jgi:asparagine synthase (glutamine-hydrolysing)